ncbi:hypothetical protein [Dactylosporangium sp. CA-152071]|uniref:hypothetical protein n=1 Tax=Dactylosporangium sp. CA-152071 TaxID=3239933 RepID=UPI003D8C88DF
MSDMPSGIVIPTVDGAPSTSALGRGVVADALRSVAPDWAREAETTKNWRGEYLRHFHRLVEAGLPSREAALAIAGDGLSSLRSRMRFRPAPDADEQPLDSAFDTPAGAPLRTATVAGTGEHGARSSCRTGASGSKATACSASSTRGWPAASSSRRARRRCGPSPPTRRGSPSKGDPSWCWAPGRRWGR